MILLLGFDKQTMEYTINGTLNTNEINIIATPSDENATVTGAGKINLNTDQNEIRIDVTAETGTVRTYIIKLNNQTEQTPQQEENTNPQPDNEQEDTQIDDTQSDAENQTEESTVVSAETEEIQKAETTTSENEANKSNYILWIIVVVAIIVLVIVVVKIRKNRGKDNV